MAGTETKLLGRIRKMLEAVDAASPGDDEQFTLTDQLAQLVALDSSLYGEICSKGRMFKVGTTTAVAAVTAIPSTAIGYAIYNNESDGGRSLVIDRIWAQNAASTAVAAQAQLLALVGQVREAAPTDATPANSLLKLNGVGGGSSPADTKVRSILTATALPATTGIAALWFPVGPSAAKPGVAATPGYGLEALISGRIIVPPGRYCAITVIANATGETFQMGFEWHEKQLRLG